MRDHETAARTLVDRADELPFGPGQVALYEEAVALADSHSDEELAFELRREMLWPAYHGNRPDLLLVHFAWCLAYLDRHPEAPPLDLLWQYRWVVDTMPAFAGVTRGHIDAAWADMRDRYQAGGWSLRPVWLLRRRILCDMGDLAGAADAHRRYVRCRADALSDDAGQDVAFAVDYQALLKRDKPTLRAAAPFLDGRITDPHLVIGFVDDALLALTRTGRAEEAHAWQKRAARLIAARPQFLGGSDNHLVFLTAVGDYAGAARFFDRNFTPALAEPGEFTQLTTYKAALFFARRLAAAGRTRVNLKVPENLIPGADGPRCRPGPLRDWLEAALPKVCRRADARNGNTYYTDGLADLAGYDRLAAALAPRSSGAADA